MKKRRIIIILLIIITAIAVYFVGGEIMNHIQVRKEIREEAKEREHVATAYARLNFAFGLTARPTSETIFQRGVFKELSEPSVYSGIRWTTYLRLRMYENRTGNYLPYEMVREYFTEEFEPDGSLRLYNNGKHPEIEAFVNWRLELEEGEVRAFFDRIEEIHLDYFLIAREQGIHIIRLRDMSPQMLDALARKEADPNYELDLTSLMQQED